MDARVAVFGDGTMGTAIASAVASQGRECILWSEDAPLVQNINEYHHHLHHFVDRTLPPLLFATTDIKAALCSAELSVIAVGSSQFRHMATQISPFVSPEIVLLSATKGLEPKTQKRMSEILMEVTRPRVAGAISGPNITTDIIDQRPTGVVVASPNNEALPAAIKLIGHPMLRVFGSSDLVGVELLGALKNVAVVAAGLAEGLGLGDNARSFIITLGLLEIQDLALRLGGRADTPQGLAGFGDLFLSTTSKHSRNHMVGVKLGQGFMLEQIIEELVSLNETAEGINTIREGRYIAQQRGIYMPLTECVYQIAFEKRHAKETLECLLSQAGGTDRLNAA